MIELRQVSKAFSGSTRYAVDRLTLAVPGGRTCVLIGPSGCGKTTTLRMINRLIEPTSGRILVEGEDVMKVDPVGLRVNWDSPDLQTEAEKLQAKVTAAA